MENQRSGHFPVNAFIKSCATALKPTIWLSGQFQLRCRRCKAQEPACEGSEDQVEAQRLPKMTARNTGGHQRIRQQQDGCPASQKERRSQGRLPPGSVEHANERVQTRDVQESAERGK